jgi:LmbE family N-acetylglucosaminyl deacetylase
MGGLPATTGIGTGVSINNHTEGRNRSLQLQSIDQITRDYRHIYFSPHFDDAVLSSGAGIMLQQAMGQRVLIITVFGDMPPAGLALSPFARQTHQKMGLPPDPRLAVGQRRAEDSAAAARLNADTLWLDYLDAIYRGQPAFYQSDEALFGDVHPGDFALDTELGREFIAIQERAPLAAFYVPLGVGHHVDHQLCCSAGDRLAQRGANVKFYEDFPYVTRPGALEARLRELGGGMEPEYVEMSHLLTHKVEAAACYRSQLPQLFGDDQKMQEALATYHHSIRPRAAIHLERSWAFQRAKEPIG